MSLQPVTFSQGFSGSFDPGRLLCELKDAIRNENRPALNRVARDLCVGGIPPIELLEGLAEVIRLKRQKPHIDGAIEPYLLGFFKFQGSHLGNDSELKTHRFILAKASLVRWLGGATEYAHVFMGILFEMHEMDPSQLEMLCDPILDSKEHANLIAPLIAKGGDLVLRKALERVGSDPLYLEVFQKCVEIYVKSHGRLPRDLLDLGVEKGREARCTSPEWFSVLFLGYEVVRGDYDNIFEKVLIEKVLHHLGGLCTSETIGACWEAIRRGRPFEFFKAMPKAQEVAVTGFSMLPAPAAAASEALPSLIPSISIVDLIKAGDYTQALNRLMENSATQAEKDDAVAFVLDLPDVLEEKQFLLDVLLKVATRQSPTPMEDKFGWKLSEG